MSTALPFGILYFQLARRASHRTQAGNLLTGLPAFHDRRAAVEAPVFFFLLAFSRQYSARIVLGWASSTVDRRPLRRPGGVITRGALFRHRTPPLVGDLFFPFFLQFPRFSAGRILPDYCISRLSIRSLSSPLREYFLPAALSQCLPFGLFPSTLRSSI